MLVVNPAYNTVREAWFDPAHWGDRAQPVSAGGRGGAWFVQTDQGDMVLRHYRRGGLVAKIARRSYVYTGQRRTRAFREFELLRILHGWGLPVPDPVAASARRSLMLYQAAILIRRIPGAVPLPEADGLADAALWCQVGRTIRRFHDAGLDHVDLNCDNLLVTGREVYLIDFDRCSLRPDAGSAGWKRSNLDRLQRSVRKRISGGLPDGYWAQLLAGYNRKA